ncbi:hypothetical protein QBC38DRAFT_494360 [Podospora fimiseda]|uniref:BED-type domain-containing protein n=1 Tax=Podospora fimiseda TaxID=252190 RepID=A0AAN7BG83_9PEZI|nr:hypothetical protein QBC38DRAFT_494360 [Podospora fimiseda]
MSSSFLLLSTVKQHRLQFFLNSLEPSLLNASDMSQDSLRSFSDLESLLSDPLDPPSSETSTTLPSEPPQHLQTWDDVPQIYKIGDSALHLMPKIGITRGWFWDYGFKVRREEDNTKTIRWLCKVCSFAKRPPRVPYTLLASNPENVYKHLGVQHKIFSKDPQQAAKYKKKQPALFQQSSIDAFTKKRKADQAFEQDQIARFDKMKFRRLIVNWLVESNLPFTAATSPALQAAFHYANPQVVAQKSNAGSPSGQKTDPERLSQVQEPCDGGIGEESWASPYFL